MLQYLPMAGKEEAEATARHGTPTFELARPAPGQGRRRLSLDASETGSGPGLGLVVPRDPGRFEMRRRTVPQPRLRFTCAAKPVPSLRAQQGQPACHLEVIRGNGFRLAVRALGIYSSTTLHHWHAHTQHPLSCRPVFCLPFLLMQ